MLFALHLKKIQTGVFIRSFTGLRLGSSEAVEKWRHSVSDFFLVERATVVSVLLQLHVLEATESIAIQGARAAPVRDVTS